MEYLTKLNIYGTRNATEAHIEEDKHSWLKKHELNIEEKYRKPLEFLRGKRLILGYHDAKAEQRQWFVTDTQATMEFVEVGSNERAVILHNKPLLNYIRAEEFVCDDGVIERMNKVLGSTNFSLALRNSEHVARYIQSGAWVSFQMASGKLREKFSKEMSPSIQALINTYPEELIKVEGKKLGRGQLYPEIESESIKFGEHVDVLSDAGKDSFNIVLLGITGSGKSSLINLLCNEEVARSGSTPVSITRNIHYLQGSYTGTILDNITVPGDSVELGSDAMQFKTDKTNEPQENFSLAPRIQKDVSNKVDKQPNPIESTINDIHTTETQRGKNEVELRKILQNLSLDKEQALKSKIKEAKIAHETAISLHEKSIQLLGRLEKELKENKETRNKVCIVDTVGLCDTLFTSDEVYDMISKSVNTKMAYMDKVIIVCSGRIEKTTADAIKQFMRWMEYSTHKKNFVFVYNKCDGMSDAEREHSLVSMCELLGADIEAEDILNNPDGSRQAIKYALATSFPPNVEYSVIKQDLETLKRAVFTRPENRIMIKAKTSYSKSCTIL